MDNVEEQHVGRVRRLDPLLPQSMPLPVAGPDDVELAVPGGAALARLVRADPATLAATWYPPERHVLIARVGADDPVAAMDALLARWTEAVRARASGTGSAADSAADSAAVLTWPSRDILPTPTFLTHGLMPAMVLAIRLAGRPSPDGPTDVVVRRATDADLDATVALELELVRWNQMLGQMTERPNTAELIRAKHTGAGRPWTWLAEGDGVPVGLLNVLDPDHAPWASGLTSAGRAVYLSDLMVLPDRRGAGTATALVQHVHRELDRTGFDAVVLHYLAMNPLAAPLWHRCGYRPLLTNWEVRPATRLRR